MMAFPWLRILVPPAFRLRNKTWQLPALLRIHLHSCPFWMNVLSLTSVQDCVASGCALLITVDEFTACASVEQLGPAMDNAATSTLLDFGEYSCVFLLSPNPGVKLLGGFWLNEVFFQSLFTSLHSDQHMSMLIAPSKIWPDIISIFKALFSYLLYVCKNYFCLKSRGKEIPFRTHTCGMSMPAVSSVSAPVQLPANEQPGSSRDGPSTWVTRMELLVLGFELT